MVDNYGCKSRIKRIVYDNYNANKYGVQKPAYEEPIFNYVDYGVNSNCNNYGCKAEYCKCKKEYDDYDLIMYMDYYYEYDNLDDFDL